MKFFKSILTLAAGVALAAASFVSCQEKETETLKLQVKQAESSADPGSQFISVSASGDWTLSLVGEDGAAPQWAWLCTYGGEEQEAGVSGTGDNNSYVLRWLTNPSTDSRTLTVILRGKTLQESAPFVQKGTITPVVDPVTITEDEIQPWMELPETKEDDGLYYINHDVEISGKKVRNYSFYWDPDNLVARWVAYPLNSWYMGSGSRSDEWGLDPKVPRKAQPVLYRAFQQFGARGHQLPSADRLSKDANIQTFYGTNMTPQDYNFNSNIWAALEGAVRNWSKMFDTLYVVTGCTVEGSTKKAYDNDGKAVTVPSGYYKALLGYAGATSTGKTKFSKFKDTGYYTGIAFYFANEDYPSKNYMGEQMTIDELEAKTGFNFFVNLPADIEKKVESAVDSGWANNFN